MGNAQGKKPGEERPDGVTTPRPFVGSPLQYTPQVNMDPNVQGNMTPHASAVEFLGSLGAPAQPKQVPVVIVWPHGGRHVEIAGSWDGWQKNLTMQRAGRDFTIVRLLSPGVYQYKFIVDGMWQHAPDQGMVHDDMGNVNNKIEVQDYTPEHPESLAPFDPPPSPKESYNCAVPVQDDFAKDAPALPPHLQLTLLNVPPASDPNACLPRPQHVILSHLYCQRGTSNVNGVVLGVTRRYKSKYVTAVMYKPAKRRESMERQMAAAQSAGATQMSDGSTAPHGGAPAAEQVAPGQPG
ncbi:unnamed protein product [Pedinophyceae sp. YPF-701]|nr:unnamed protein product [Pedinophyceae sp. YPF-701]